MRARGSFLVQSAMWGMLLLSTSSVSVARTFNFKDESFGAYFRGTAGFSGVGTDQIDNSAGSNVDFDKKAHYNLSGEVGFIVYSTSHFNLRVGGELMSTDSVMGAKGSSGSGTPLFDLDSRVLAVNPMATFEYIFKPTDHSRFLAYLGLGSATVSLKNSYTFTSAGQTVFGQGASLSESSTAQVTNYNLGVGYEILFVDSVTAMFDLGYRYMPVNELKYTKATTTFDGTAVGKGDKVINADGSTRKFDLSGVYLGVSFRFYVNFR
jgi:opacity protein-like surface antigen